MDINNNIGLIRIDNEIEYKSSTQAAEEFINARLSAAIAGWNKNRGGSIPDEGVQLVSRVYSYMKKDPKPVFVPFWLTLPLSALDDGQDNRKNNKQSGGTVDLMNMAARYMGDEEGDTGAGTITLREPYASIIEQYMFKKEDLKGFYDRDFMRRMHLNVELVNKIRKHAKPHIHRFHKGCTRVIVLIDPKAVFKDMVEAGNKNVTDLNNRPFEVYLHANQQTATGKWQYIVKCATRNDKKNKKGKRNGGNMSENEMISNSLTNL